MDRLSRSRTQKVLGFVLRSRLVMYFRDVFFSDTKLNLKKIRLAWTFLELN